MYIKEIILQFRKFFKLSTALIFFLAIFLGNSTLYAEDPVSKKINFQAGDGVTVTADLYMDHDTSAPFIVLFSNE